MALMAVAVLNGSEQLFASRYKRVLPTKEELRRELDRERASLMGQGETDGPADAGVEITPVSAVSFIFLKHFRPLALAEYA